MIRLLVSIISVAFLTGCVFIGRRQTLSNAPVRFYNAVSGADLAEVLIVPRYSEKGEVRLGEPFVYHRGSPFILRIPVSFGLLVATTYVGDQKSVDGFAVFARGYRARWGGYGEEVGEYNSKIKKSPINRRVGLYPTTDIDSQCIDWLSEVINEDEISLDMEHASVFGFGSSYSIKNGISPSGIRLIQNWAEPEPLIGSGQ